MKYILRDYQEEGEKDIQNFLFNSSFKKGICVSPVATGKSIYPAIISKLIEKNVLVIQPNTELLEQNIEKARSFGLDPTIYSASSGSKNISEITYATPMSIVNNLNDFKNFKTVVIDECHLNLSNSISNGKIKDKGKLNQFLEQINPDKIIGLTATPIQLVTTNRGSELKMLNRSMRSFWYKSDLFHITQIEDIEEKYWANIKTDIINNDTSLLSKSRFNSSEFSNESIIKQYEANGLEYQILEQYERLISNNIDSILTFVPNVEQAINLKKKNKDFEVVYDKTPKKERKAIVDAFKRGDIPNLINCLVFTAGFDYPDLKGLIIGRDTMSLQLFYQIYGRIVRPIIRNNKIIKKEGLIVDLTGNTDRFGDISKIKFEKNDYTNGWGMWNNNKLLTGYPFGDWNMPDRNKLIYEFNNKGVIDKNEIITDLEIKFGKYKGKKLIESFKKDPRYFTWVYEKFDWNNSYSKPLYNSLKQLIDKNLMHG